MPSSAILKHSPSWLARLSGNNKRCLQRGYFPLEPSLVVESSPGHYHRYWLVADDWPADEQGRKDFARVMATMVATYGSEKGAKDISGCCAFPASSTANPLNRIW